MKGPEILEIADDALVPIKRASELLGITDRRIRDLAKDGYIPKDSRGLVPLFGAVQGYVRFLKDEERRASKSAAAADVQKARAEEIRLRVARESGKLIDLEDTEAAFSDILGAWRSELDGMARAVTRDLALREKIDAYVNEAAARCRARFAAARERLKKGMK